MRFVIYNFIIIFSAADIDNKLYYVYNTVINCISSVIQFSQKGGSIFMISFDQFILEDGIPIYLQILTYIKHGMIAGTIMNGD